MDELPFFPRGIRHLRSLLRECLRLLTKYDLFKRMSGSESVDSGGKCIFHLHISQKYMATLYICLRFESSINSLTLSAILPDKPRQQHNTDTHKILMTCIILIWGGKKLSLLNQIHRENRTSKTVTLRHDDRCAFLRITRGITQSSGSSVKSLRQRRQRS